MCKFLRFFFPVGMIFLVTMAYAEPGETITMDLPGGAQMEMVWIEPGTFVMGTTDSEISQLNATCGSEPWCPSTGEGPQHEVAISRGFYLGKHEITQGQWQDVMGTQPWEGQVKVEEAPNHPAV